MLNEQYTVKFNGGQSNSGAVTYTYPLGYTYDQVMAFATRTVEQSQGLFGGFAMKKEYVSGS